MESINALISARDQLNECDIKNLTPAQAAELAANLSYILAFASQDDADDFWEQQAEPKRYVVLEQEIPF